MSILSIAVRVTAAFKVVLAVILAIVVVAVVGGNYTAAPEVPSPIDDMTPSHSAPSGRELGDDALQRQVRQQAEQRRRALYGLAAKTREGANLLDQRP